MRHPGWLAAIVLVAGGCSRSQREPAPEPVGDDPNIEAVREYEPSGSPTAKVEMRLAEEQPQKGTSEVFDEASRSKLYVHPEVLFTVHDISKTRLVYYHDKPTWAVYVTFTPEATKRFARLTTESKGKLLALLVDGRCVRAMAIHGPIENGVIQIVGRLTRDSADQLARQLVGR